MTGSEHPMISVSEALRICLGETARLVLTSPRSTETVRVQPSTLDLLLGRTLAKDVIMREPGYPPYRASIMDGFVIRTSEYESGTADDNEWTHAIRDKIYAGNETIVPEDHQGGLPRAYYVTTGAVVPPGFDCVVPIEQCRVSNDPSNKLAIVSSAIIQEGQWIRPVGCDIAAGSVVLLAGHVFDAVALGLLLQSGCESVELCRPLVIGVLSTGNELLTDNSDWSQMRAGIIPDVNRPILLSLLSSWGTCCVKDLGTARDDDINAMAARIESALPECNVIITTGGISMGETDVVEHVLVERLGGRLQFGRMHMKPGKPTTFVTIPSDYGMRLVFAMPGNPVSATVCTHLLVRPCLDLLLDGPDRSADTHGESVEEQIHRIVENAYVHAELSVPIAQDMKLDRERPEYHRVMLQLAPNGTYRAMSTGVQRSSRLASLRDAQGLLCLPQATTDKPKALAGERYIVLLLNHDKAQRVPLYQSMHLRSKNAPSKSMIRLRVVQVVASHVDSFKVTATSNISERVEKTLSGSVCGSACAVSSSVYNGPLDDLCDFITQSNADPTKDGDIVIISCPKFEGSFKFHVKLSQLLRARLTKVADAMALQARRGAASQDPTTALFEVVVGFLPNYGKRGAMMILLPEEGLDGALGNVRGLLKHALRIARGSDGHGH